jgi:hypothetical protein
MPSTMPDRDALASTILEMLPEAKVRAARFPGSDALIIARKMAINKMLAAEEEIAPAALAAASQFPAIPERGVKGADPVIVARKQAINKQLQAEETGQQWR